MLITDADLFLETEHHEHVRLQSSNPPTLQMGKPGARGTDELWGVAEIVRGRAGNSLVEWGYLSAD